ncbi:DUF2877 domain-containing protein [Buttiauxella sp. B2]|uniref:DUF2877 domain-containing protein n=1 Tax=Buttiauxella sp. B2 TaxID=2587812 RepID=UPI00111CC3E4|nr:DUF2877 domain-containing protein [Buttiauxella sp. B2]TNV20693.1 DUF2877 domain-containing protein [Buttiauxella sp. B2]
MIYAQASSLHAPYHLDNWRVAGVYTRAINLVGKSGNLLTLQRAGNGISPMSWVLRSHDFDSLRETLTSGCKVNVTPHYLELGKRKVYAPQRRYSLRLVSTASGGNTIPESYVKRGDETGLYGPLSSALSHPLHSELLKLMSLFRQTLRGRNVDWCSHLGKGPGLTPTHDDLLVGMLLAARLNGVLKDDRFFAASGSLRAATTMVSVAYLEYAARGIFASPLLHFAYALSKTERLPMAVEQLLSLGHTSGADTLLGFWLGLQAIRLL